MLPYCSELSDPPRAAVFQAPYSQGKLVRLLKWRLITNTYLFNFNCEWMLLANCSAPFLFVSICKKNQHFVSTDDCLLQNAISSLVTKTIGIKGLRLFLSPLFPWSIPTWITACCIIKVTLFWMCYILLPRIQLTVCVSNVLPIWVRDKMVTIWPLNYKAIEVKSYYLACLWRVMSMCRSVTILIIII